MKKKIYDNGYYRVYDENNIISLEALKGGVIIIPITLEGKFILIKVFRKPTKEISIEFPRGFIEIEESSLNAAKRELYEEINGTAKSFEYLGSTTTNNGISNEEPHYYIAWDTNFSYENIQTEEGLLQVIELSSLELINMIKKNEIKDAFTISGALKFFVNNYNKL